MNEIKTKECEHHYCLANTLRCCKCDELRKPESNLPEEWEKGTIVFNSVETDGVGVQFRKQEGKFLITVSGTKEYVIDVTEVFTHFSSPLLAEAKKERDGEYKPAKIVNLIEYGDTLNALIEVPNKDCEIFLKTFINKEE